MNEFKTREECLRYYVDKYNKERDWEPEVDFDKLLPMLYNPVPTPSDEEFEEVARVRLENDFYEDPFGLEGFRRVMEYFIIEIVHYYYCHGLNVQLLMFFNEFDLYDDYGDGWEEAVLMWIVFSEPLVPSAEKKLRKFINGSFIRTEPIEMPNPVVWGDESSSDYSDENLLLQLVPAFFADKKTAEDFVKQIKNTKDSNIINLVYIYKKMKKCATTSKKLYDILHDFGRFKTGYKNWNKMLIEKEYAEKTKV